MSRAHHEVLAEMTIDIRSALQARDAMFNNQTVSLNTELNLLTHLPAQLHRQLNPSTFKSSVHHLPAQHIIVRVDVNIDDYGEMKVRILQDLIPFDVISTIVLPEDDTFKPVIDTRPLSQ